jgi:adenylate cyclase
LLDGVSLMRQSIAPVRALAVVAVVAVGLSLVAYETGLLRRVELDTVDARFAVRGTEQPPEDLVVVEIDEVSFETLDRRWPFPRSLHGELVRRLDREGAGTIAYDVQFTEPTTPREDNALIRAVADAGDVVLSTTEVNDRGKSDVFGGEGVLRQIGARAGSTLIEPDAGGVFRRVPFDQNGLESFAVATVETKTGSPVDPGEFDDGEAWIDYHGPAGTIETVSFSDVLMGRFADGLFEDATVVVGVSAPTVQDVHPTPFESDELMAGAEIQANAISTVERGVPVASAPGPLSVGLIILLGLVAPAAGLRLRPVPLLGLAGLVGVAYVVAVQLSFDSGTILPLIYPLAALALSTVGVVVVHYVVAAFERQRTRDTFSRFVPEQVVDEVLTRDGDLRLGGVRRECTVLFSDLRGFTSFAETREPDHVIEVLNRYLSEMSDAIMDHGGTLVSYMGDGIMAVFGAPLEQPDHADRALTAAREMVGTRLDRFNRALRDEGLGEGFRMGVGLNSGPVMSGQVGSTRRVEYTAIGDTTNTAARLESMTRGTPHDIFVSDTTKEALTDPPADLISVGEFEIRGRQSRLRIWTLSDPGRSGPAAIPYDHAAASSAAPSSART